MADFIIVGSGLTGATIARQLSDAGKKVLVIDRRPQVGGNVADFTHPSGIQIHRYGPHLFRTVSDEIWKFLNRFTHFHSYKHQIKSRVDGKLECWPIADSYIRRACGENWKPELQGNGLPQNFEEAALSMMPRVIYERFVKGYSEKQWGVPASTLAASLCRRFDVRHDNNPYLTPKAKYQGIPTEGYSVMMQRMLSGIPVITNFDYLKDRTAFKARTLTLFTGPIDEYFNFELGTLAYRGQKREHSYLPETEWAQPSGQVNNPGDCGAHIRDIEWKHIMRPDYAARIRGTVLTRETPWSPDNPEDYEYPFPNETNEKLYKEYRKMAVEDNNVLICGRLGEYRYYDMDHAIGRALMLARKIINRQR
jgi:UDP-galactopyranose mutase